MPRRRHLGVLFRSFSVSHEAMGPVRVPLGLPIYSTSLIIISMSMVKHIPLLFSTLLFRVHG